MVALTEYEEISNTVADFIKHNRAHDQTEMFDTIHNRFYAAFVVKRSSICLKMQRKSNEKIFFF